jgi:hypothetical protein
VGYPSVHDICQRAVGAVGEVVEVNVTHALVEHVGFERIHFSEDEAAAADAVGFGVVPEGRLSVMMMVVVLVLVVVVVTMTMTMTTTT